MLLYCRMMVCLHEVQKKFWFGLILKACAVKHQVQRTIIITAFHIQESLYLYAIQEHCKMLPLDMINGKLWCCSCSGVVCSVVGFCFCTWDRISTVVPSCVTFSISIKLHNDKSCLSNYFEKCYWAGKKGYLHGLRATLKSGKKTTMVVIQSTNLKLIYHLLYWYDINKV